MRKLLVLVTFLSLVLLTACGTEYPVVLNKGQDVINVGETFVDAGCDIDADGTLVAMDANLSGLDNTTVGTYTVAYSKSYDGSSYSCDRTVVVADLTAPVVTLNPGVDTLYVGETFTDAGVAVEDYDNTPTIVVDGTVDTSAAGNYTLTYTVSDDAGNTTIVSRVVHVMAE